MERHGNSAEVSLYHCIIGAGSETRTRDLNLDNIVLPIAPSDGRHRLLASRPRKWRTVHTTLIEARIVWCAQDPLCSVRFRRWMSHQVNKLVNVLSHQDVENYVQPAPQPLRGLRVEAAPREIRCALAVFFVRRAVSRALEAESGWAELVSRRARRVE